MFTELRVRLCGMIKRYLPFLIIAVYTAVLAAVPHRSALAEGITSASFSHLSIAVVAPGAGSPAVTRAREYNRNVGVDVIDVDGMIADAAAMFERNFGRAVTVGRIEDVKAPAPDLIAVLDIRYALPDGADTGVHYEVSAAIMGPDRRTIDTLRGSGSRNALSYSAPTGAARIRQAMRSAVRNADTQMEEQLQSSLPMAAFVASNLMSTKTSSLRPLYPPAAGAAAKNRTTPQQASGPVGGTRKEPFAHLSVAVVVPDSRAPAVTAAADYNRKSGIVVMDMRRIIADAAGVFERNFKRTIKVTTIEDARKAAPDLVAILEFRYSLPDSWDNDVSYDVAAAIMTPDRQEIEKLRGSRIRSPLSFFAASGAKRISEAINAASKEANAEMEGELLSSVRLVAFAGGHPRSAQADALPASASTGTTPASGERHAQKTQTSATASQSAEARAPASPKPLVPVAAATAAAASSAKAVAEAAPRSGQRSVAERAGQETVPGARREALPPAQTAVATESSARSTDASRPGAAGLAVQPSATNRTDQPAARPAAGGPAAAHGLTFWLRLAILCAIVVAVGYVVVRRSRD